MGIPHLSHQAICFAPLVHVPLMDFVPRYNDKKQQLAKNTLEATFKKNNNN